ncbi:MAG TPA: hypothetical protein VI916_03145 [Acidimicrobiia bacterium]|nr:hypothetical protein [Acidimicrobiia bacterium]
MDHLEHQPEPPRETEGEIDMTAITAHRPSRRRLTSRPFETFAFDPHAPRDDLEVRWRRLDATDPIERIAAVPVPRAPSRRSPTSSVSRRPSRAIVFRRRRLAVVIVLMLVAFTAGVLLAITLLSSPAGGSLTDDARRAQQVTYVVEPGDTLWRAALSLAPNDDPRAVVDALSASRGTSEVRVGEQLVWPVD